MLFKMPHHDELGPCMNVKATLKQFILFKQKQTKTNDDSGMERL